ncbi:MAG: ADOP family duplicated permease [Gemmatimonadales bacterium]
MGAFPGIRRTFRLLAGRRSVDADLEAELAFHFEETVRELESRGLSEAEARAEARHRFGDASAYRVQLRRIDRLHAGQERRSEWLRTLGADVILALRGIRRSPGFALVVALTLGLGIGANATMFGIIDRLLLSPPAHVENPDQVRRLFVDRTFLERRVQSETMSYPDLLDFDSASTLADVAGYFDTWLSYGPTGEGRRIRVDVVTPSFFPLLGVRPLIGRFPTPEEDVPDGGIGVAVLGQEFWNSEFSGSSAVLGQTIRIGHGRYVVIGVAPRGFTGVSLSRVDAWLPLHTAAGENIGGPWETSRGILWVQALVRARPGATRERVETELTLLHRNGNRDRRRYDPEARILAEPLRSASGPGATDETRVSAWLVGVSLIVLLIACANVANMLLVRAIRRQRELAVRLALGAGRGRIVLQLLMESVTLAVVATGAGLLIAFWGGQLIRNLLLPGVAWPAGPLGLRVVLFSFLTALAAGLGAGLVAAARASRAEITTSLKSGAREGGFQRSRLRTGLLLFQGALSMVLLVGAGLFVRSLHRVQNLDLGLDVGHLIAVSFETPEHFGASRMRQMVESSLARLTAVPGISGATATNSLPFYSSWAEELRIPGVDSIPVTSNGGPYINTGTADYFAVTGMRIIRGRAFGPADVQGSPRVAVVNRTMARLVWGETNAIGRCMKIGGDTAPCAEVVGVVADSRRQAVVEDPTLQYYVADAQRILDITPTTILVRTDADPEAMVSTIRRELGLVIPQDVYPSVRPLEALVAPQLRSWRLGASLFSLFGLLALLVAAIGTYSVLAYAVAQRRHELGVRAALGAGGRELIGLVVGYGLRITGAGLVLGALIAAVAARPLSPLLYQVSPRDPVVYAAVALVLLSAAGFASLVPAWRASRVDPATVLRSE